jgi:hypothetical protein
MFSLETAQANFISTINEGPNALDHALFEGPIDRVLLGLKAHANTVSHARLVALEETFPLTRQALGEERFNALSRTYAETPEARACDTNSIGKPFLDFLRSSEAAAAEIDLAAIEWAWLQAYHAADAVALKLSDIAGLPAERLIALPVTAHTAAHIVTLNAHLSDQLSDIAALTSHPAAIVAVRPQTEVQLVPMDTATLAVFATAEKTTTIGNLLALSAEHANVTDPAGPVMTLLGAGALMEAGYASDTQHL